MYKTYQISVHHDKPEDVTMRGFDRFLCSGPLIVTPIKYEDEETGRKAVQEGRLPENYGPYHLCKSRWSATCCGTDEYQCTGLMARLLPYLCLTLRPLGYLQYIASGILTGHGQASVNSPLSMKSASQDCSALLGRAKSLAVRV